jgi:signal transduction histidine kinase
MSLPNMKDGPPTRSNILIVDDVPENLKVLMTFLQGVGFGIHVAQNGEDAISLLEQFTPDLILLDVLMPGIDGFETCRRLKQKKETQEIPVIFMTALSETVDKVKGFEAGGVDYITKPLHQQEVLARVNTHLSLRKVQKDLSQLNASKDKFFSIIAHDLKNPFVGLMSLSKTLLESFETLDQEEIQECIQGIHETSKHGFHLLSNLLEWAKSQTGRIQWSPKYIDLRPIMLQNFALLETKAKEKKISLHCNVPANTCVYADANMVDTVVRNLATNALKYTENGGKVSISSHEAEDFVEISVDDTGVGIQEEDICKLFKIEIKYSSLGTAKEQGTGLGLILCKEFIEKNKGKIWVESKVGKGSSFKFVLPKDQSE